MADTGHARWRTIRDGDPGKRTDAVALDAAVRHGRRYASANGRDLGSVTSHLRWYVPYESATRHSAALRFPEMRAFRRIAYGQPLDG